MWHRPGPVVASHSLPTAETSCNWQCSACSQEGTGTYRRVCLRFVRKVWFSLLVVEWLLVLSAHWATFQGTGLVDLSCASRHYATVQRGELNPELQAPGRGGIRGFREQALRLPATGSSARSCANCWKANGRRGAPMPTSLNMRSDTSGPNGFITMCLEVRTPDKC